MSRRQVNSRDTEAATRFPIIGLLALLCGMASSLTMAQERLLVEGILDAEVYKTDARSFSLARNNGDISTLGRLQLWSAWQISSGLQIYSLGEIVTDDAAAESETESEIRQFAVRYSNNSSSYLFIEAGKLLPPIAIASERRLSTQNPLIGQPEFIYTSYPLGIQALGSTGWLDYRAALVDLPAVNPEYLPAEPGSALRPDLGIGVTPFTGLRFGLAYTKGPYLNRGLGAFLPPGSGWKDFDQRLLGFEFQFSHGYAELNSELVLSRYEVPFQGASTNVSGYFAELKYAWTPRLYSALRLQRNEYPFIQHLGELTWMAQTVRNHDVEIGLTYRFSADTQLKVAYRHDLGNMESSGESVYPVGHSLALQFSHHFDLRSWFRTER
jgi:hypothetical protein